jgi:hypothetical protein
MKEPSRIASTAVIALCRGLLPFNPFDVGPRGRVQDGLLTMAPYHAWVQIENILCSVFQPRQRNPGS